MKPSKTKQELEQELGRVLASLREKRGLSQEALGVQLGKGQSNIAKIEGGNKRITVLEMLEWLVALGLSFSEFEPHLVKVFEELGGTVLPLRTPDNE